MTQTVAALRWGVVERVWECHWHCPGCPNLVIGGPHYRECKVLVNGGKPEDCPEFEEPEIPEEPCE